MLATAYPTIENGVATPHLTRERAHHFDFRERDHFVYDRERDFRERDHFVYDRERDAYAWKTIVYVVLTLIPLVQVLPDERQ